MLVTLFFTACQKDEMQNITCEHPVAIEEFKINFIERFMFNKPFAMDIDESFRLSYKLIDDGVIIYHELFMLINNDEDLKVRIFGPENNLDTDEKRYTYTITNLEQFTLINQEVYKTTIGEKLHFYLTIIDDSANIVERIFVLDLEF
jgi:hypothetical protein